ncbi:MAG: hypothetical protein ACOYNS_10455 [Bacteroidota bacterium]
MITMDAIAVVIAVFGLLGGLIAFISFVSQRPTRKEVDDAIKKSVEPISDDLKYLRDRIDEIVGIIRKQ